LDLSTALAALLRLAAAVAAAAAAADKHGGLRLDAPARRVVAEAVARTSEKLRRARKASEGETRKGSFTIAPEPAPRPSCAPRRQALLSEQEQASSSSSAGTEEHFQ
jgi:hypothetical protein